MRAAYATAAGIQLVAMVVVAGPRASQCRIRTDTDGYRFTPDLPVARGAPAARSESGLLLGQGPGP